MGIRYYIERLGICPELVSLQQTPFVTNCPDFDFCAVFNDGYGFFSWCLFIDEQRYATAFVRDKSRYNKWGRQKIKSELIRRGIPSHHIDTALCEINEDENTETLRHIIDTKRRTVKGKTEYEVRTKLIRFALSRGFEMSDILKVVGSADNDEW